MTRLSIEQISRENGNCEASSVTSLQLSHRAFSDVLCLRKFQNLERLDLSYNCLTSLEALSSCINLRWLQVLENKLVTLKGIEGFSKLTVLNAGKNKLEKMDEVCSLSNLRALILNDNNISSICKLDQMKHLNTLVLSRNPIHSIDNSLKKATSITKLSLSRCRLQSIGASLVECVELKEARFSHNEITTLPEELAKNTKLQNLDVGNNSIEKLTEVKVLSALHNLKNLNLLGNPIAENDNLLKKVKRLVPNIRVFNAKPLMNSKLSLMASQKGSLHPTEADSGVKDYKKRKKRDSEEDDASQRKRLNTSVEENPSGNKRKKKMIHSRSPVDNSTSGSMPVKMGTKKKSKSNTELHTNKAYTQKTSRASMEENIDKNDENSSVLKDIDDAEARFVDLIFSGKKTVEGFECPSGRETVCDVKPIQNGKKMKKRSKGMESGLSAWQLFSSKCDVGMGGQSTWDA